MIATPLEERLLQRIAEVDPRIQLLHDPELLPPPRFPMDHAGSPDFRRRPVDEQRFWEMVASAEVMLGIPGDTPEGLSESVRRGRSLRWVQATAAGAGQQLLAAALSPPELKQVVLTSSRGIHSAPLAEFALMGILMLTHDAERLRDAQVARRWEQFAHVDLEGKVLLVVGAGEIGRRVATVAACLGMEVVGIRRSARATDPLAQPIAALPELAQRADVIILCLPLTDATARCFGPQIFARLKPSAVLVNIGRGGVVDEVALVEALRSRRLAGAVLDVFATEPLPSASPLWEMPNVILSSHTAGISLHENERLVELFVDNLRRFRSGRQMRNVVSTEEGY